VYYILSGFLRNAEDMLALSQSDTVIDAVIVATTHLKVQRFVFEKDYHQFLTLFFQSVFC